VTSPLRRSLLAAVVVLAVAAGGYAVSRSFSTVDDTSTASAAVTTAPGGAGAGSVTGVDAARTATEPVETDPPEHVATDAPHTPAAGRADVVVSYADWDAASSSVEVDGFVGSRVEDGGTCTVTLTRDGDKRTATSQAFADASTTICPPILVSGGELHSGRWTAVLAYSSSLAKGTSDAVEVTVP
jgi:hypothetical protein